MPSCFAQKRMTGFNVKGCGKLPQVHTKNSVKCLSTFRKSKFL